MIKNFIIWITTFVLIFAMLPSYAMVSDNSSQINLEAPLNLSVTVEEKEDGTPVFRLEWTNPQSIIELQNKWTELGEAPLSYQIDFKVGDGKWDYEINGDLIRTNGLDNWAEYDPVDEGKAGEIDIKSNNYQFRVRYEYYDIENSDYEDCYCYSSFSNIFEIGMQAFYKNASTWAIPELDKAYEYGLITDKIKDKMNAPITREEFAEIAVKLYEKSTDKQATYSDFDAFVDTKNPEIFKAFNLKIVNGTNLQQKLFSPNDLTNREQVAAMLYRAVSVIQPDTDFSIDGADSFSDEKQISDWAINSVKFMNKNGFIKGANGKFDPKGTCTREQAVLIAVRVFEKYTGISD